MLVFGTDRLPNDAEAYCPAWPSPATLKATRTAAYNRFLWPKGRIAIGGAEVADTEAKREAAFKRYIRGSARSVPAAIKALTAMRVEA